ncbi:MAG: efflux RND transporter permease subunit [Epsilonproteobacteria bacterium]|nr:efflux RND transporter permease subunit [Campylobacterota bacterium]OIO14532.1 MAG: multidrug transporter AcrB [Helicobacteraceae bacterium CG1_02_36_14]PIP10633.1 MAG: multidrug transporter AcrB [Sulfurimonas sp. CG23_combo_of_CG06-09_8_20_14_all_36_33]PIS25606.1 MAG: AcrB/AcrD/AcrF family protein [Sulfurimonas sp. CG08_land_8_20_14_0_20_36_33]PIU34913.1 MAG: AcrB/AcrD/AcrF family protein [Sulfurimonas sp. CG07_land_8_20_14_0_80_36_56]PIV04626.1 MAG: AcrB/AcrD/AcrF family protein [Sulfurim
MFQKFENTLLSSIQSPKQRKIILFATLLAFILSILMIAPTKMVLAKMLPGKNNDTFTIYATLPIGSAMSQTKEVTECIVEHIQKESEVVDMEVFLGLGSPLDFAGLIKGSHFKNSENVAEVVLNLTKKHNRVEPSYLMVQRMRPIIVQNCASIYPNTVVSFVEPPAGPPVLAAIVAEIYGNDPEGIRELASTVSDVFKKTEGLVDVDIMQDHIYDTFEIIVDSTKVTRSGVSLKQLNDILYLAFEGMQIAVKNSDIYNDQIPIYLSLSEASKKFTTKDIRALEIKLSSLKLMNKMGMMIPLTELSKIILKKSNPMIMSKNLHQMTNVMAETDMVSQVYPLMEARDTIIQTFSDRYEIKKTGLFNLQLTEKSSQKVYDLVWDGEMEVTLDTFVELGAAFIAALVLIFLLMVIYYKSYTISGIILLGSFLSIIGVIVGHWIMNIFTTDTFFLTATSLIGFIALIGISSRNSLLLIDFTKSLMLEKGMHKAEAIAYATATRAKPIFLTATAIILASTLLAGDAVFGGLGVSLIFGTIAAVVASLIIVPVLLNMSDLESHFHFHEKKAVSILEP